MLGWLGQRWTGCAGVGLVVPVLVQLCQCPASAGGWREVEKQDHAVGRAQEGVLGKGPWVL